MRALPPIVTTVALALALTGCTPGSTPDPSPTATGGASSTQTPTGSAEPTPTPSPTETEAVDPHPDLDALVVSTSGLGPLTVGVPPEDNPGAEMLEWDAEACIDFAPDPDNAGLWVASGYEAGTNYMGEPVAPPFFVDADDEGVHRIDLMVSEPATEAGVRIGSSLEELRKAYPDLEGPFDGPVSDVWWIADEHGSLVFETQGDDDGLRPAGTAESVILIRVLAPGWAPDFATANSGDVAGACPL